jgi:hypothetical protein
VTGLPPSSSGLSHFNLQPFFVTSDTFRGPFGFDGAAKMKRHSQENIAIKELEMYLKL